MPSVCCGIGPGMLRVFTCIGFAWAYKTGLDENISEPLFLQVALETTGDSFREHSSRDAESRVAGSSSGHRDHHRDHQMVFAHVPYNFGHTIEKVAFAGSGHERLYLEGQLIVEGLTLEADQRELLERLKVPGGELWGRMNPELHEISNITGCPMYFTPGKHWPTALAEAYFGDHERFGVLRDPYERLVAQFRGSYPGYGGDWGPERLTCEVDTAIKKKMQGILSGAIDPYSEECAFLPQAHYFDAPYGITLAVDNRYFPKTANELFEEYGYSMSIATSDILHVEGCDEVWAGDLSCETKSLVRQVYARDFELLCQHFGYCDPHENVCLTLVPQMCPSNLASKNLSATYCASTQ